MIKAIQNSRWFDALGVIIVIVTAAMLGYLSTTLAQAKIDMLSQLPFARFVPLGIVATVSAVLSLLSTRLVAKQNNLGNVISTWNIVLAGVIDFILGNVGAIFTYPVSFLITYIASKTWERKPIAYRKAYTVPIIIGAFILSSALNGLATLIMHYQLTPIFWLSTVVFALSLVANMLNVFQLGDQWSFWLLYNIVQFGKAVSQGNFANVGKYLYYVTNAIMTLVTWHAPKDRK